MHAVTRKELQVMSRDVTTIYSVGGVHFLCAYALQRAESKSEEKERNTTGSGVYTGLLKGGFSLCQCLELFNIH